MSLAFPSARPAAEARDRAETSRSAQSQSTGGTQQPHTTTATRGQHSRGEEHARERIKATQAIERGLLRPPAIRCSLTAIDSSRAVAAMMRGDCSSCLSLSCLSAARFSSSVMAGTFWSNFGLRFNPASSSNGIDELLEKGEGHFTLSEVLLHDQCIQEAKYMNLQLCEYLSQPKIVTQLVQYIITVPPDAREAAQNPNEVGGGIDTNGSITTAASIKKKAEKAKAAVAAAAAAAAAKEAAAASSSSSSSSDAAASSADVAAPAASSPADGPTTLDLAAQSGSPPEAKTDAESSDSFTHSSESDSDEENDDSPRSTAARAASKAASDAEAAADAEQKFPYLASELFACEVPSMLDVIFDDGEALSRRDSVSVSATSTSTLEKVAEDAPAEESKQDAAASAASAAASSTTSPPASAVSATSPASASSPSSSSAPSARRLPILDLLLSFLDQPAPIDPAHASYFRKVMVVLIQRKYEPLVKYMSAHGTLDKLLRHVGLYSMMELLIMIVRAHTQKHNHNREHSCLLQTAHPCLFSVLVLSLQGWDDGLGGNQDVAWLVEEDLTGKLLAKLHPRWELEEKQPDVLINASRALVDVVVSKTHRQHTRQRGGQGLMRRERLIAHSVLYLCGLL